MKRKIFATVMALVLCTATLVGCGGSADSSAEGSYEEPTTNPEVVVKETEEAPTASPEPSNNIEADIQEDTNELTEDETEQVLEEENAPVEEEVVSTAGEAEGIIVLQNYFYRTDDGTGYTIIYSIKSIDSSTGMSTSIAEFSAERPYSTAIDKYYYLLPTIGTCNPYGNDRRYFSSDFSKMAVTKVFVDKNETHVGWLDQSGNFFDVTEALGEQSSDFGDPVTYGAVGFTEDGLFVYDDNALAYFPTWSSMNFRFTDIDTFSPSQEGNPLYDSCQIDTGYHLYTISDCIDDNTRIIYYQEKSDKIVCAKYNIASGEVINFIPGESRSNWSGVCSPDGSQVAFLSMPSTGNGNPEIFIIPSEGGEPEKLNCNIVFSNDENTGLSSILEWK